MNGGEILESRCGAGMGKKENQPPPNVEFHMYLGFCIAAWANVEERLFETLRAVLGTAPQYASIVYYRSPSVNARAGLIDELVVAALPKTANGKKAHPDLADWKSLKKTINNLLATRRKIAHQPVSVRYHRILAKDEHKHLPPKTRLPQGAATLVPSSFQVLMSTHEQMRGSGDQKPLYVDDLSLHAVAVLRLADKLHEFRIGPLQAHLRKTDA